MAVYTNQSASNVLQSLEPHILSMFDTTYAHINDNVIIPKTYYDTLKTLISGFNNIIYSPNVEQPNIVKAKELKAKVETMLEKIKAIYPEYDRIKRKVGGKRSRRIRKSRKIKFRRTKRNKK